MPLRGPSALSASSSQDTADVAPVLISKKSWTVGQDRKRAGVFCFAPPTMDIAQHRRHVGNCQQQTLMKPKKKPPEGGSQSMNVSGITRLSM